MIKFVRQKSRDNSAAKGFFKKKGESNDSGTESDGEILDADKHLHRNLEFDMETSLSSCPDANSPTDTACSSESSAMMCQSHLLCDQHSSEEELEVINGPASVAAVEAAAAANKSVSSSVVMMRGTSSYVSERNSSSLETDELFGNDATTSKRASSTLMENRKRSLVHGSDDELRSHLEPVLTPVNFRTTPPLEAFKPNRSHMFRSTTPLILSEARCGIENMKLCDNSVNADESLVKEGRGAAVDTTKYDNNDIFQENGNSSVINKTLKTSNSSHVIYQPLTTYNYHYNSSRSSPASTSGLDIEVRSVSPPAKLFHCAISPKRRPASNKLQQQQQQQQQQQNLQQQATHRLQRPHRPCLDFDKMQQVSLH